MWIFAIYNQSDCAGNMNKYTLVGEDNEGFNEQCQSPNYTHIDSSTAKTMSWKVFNGNCTVYDTSDCSKGGQHATYDTSQGCHNHGSGLGDIEKWASVQCFALEDANVDPIPRALWTR